MNATPTKPINSLPLRRYLPSNRMPLDVGIIHFIGIGGIGMSGIAEILHNLGYQVAGSDVSESANVKRMRAMGVSVTIGHAAENVDGVAVVVRSTAVPLTNPEVVAAREKQIPVVKRAEMLAELTHLKATIAIAGSHGKTTTTSMVGHVLATAGLDPTVINGGIINTYGTNAYLGKGDWLVVEADESDGTFIKIPSTVGVITNLDPEHLDHWKTFDALKEGFRDFLHNQPFYGFGVVCYDHPIVKEIAQSITDRRIIGYAIDDESADIRGQNLRAGTGGTFVDITIGERVTGDGVEVLKDVRIPVPGKHNVLNAMAALAIGKELKIGTDHILKALSTFEGVKRRFTKTGEVNGYSIIDDYGHHPVEINATLSAAREVAENTKGRVIAVVQPHRYSRLENLFKEFSECFDNADHVVVTEVYSAGEKPIEGVNRDTLVEALIKRGAKVTPLESPEALAAIVDDLARPGDIVVCLGAGSISAWANALPEQIAGLKKKAG